MIEHSLRTKGKTMTNKPILKSVLTGVAILMAPVYAHAFGLGNIKVSSALNTPFRAEIPVTSFEAADKDSFLVGLASNSEFITAGLDRNSALIKLRFKVEYRNGKPFIKISSSQAMKEPFLSFLVSATTNNNKLLREYTVLLDPPTSIYTPTVDAPAKTVAPTRSARAQSVPPVAVTPTPRAPSMAGTTNYGVKRGDTLWGVASKVRPDSSVSHEQMMLAILKANPDAFVGRNINGLKAGQELHIPEKSEVMSLSRKEALAAVAAEHVAWQSRLNQAQQKTAVKPTTAAQESSTEERVEPVVEKVADDGAEDTAETSDTPDTTTAMETPASESEARLALTAPSDTDLEAEQELVAAGDDQIRQVNEQLSLAQERIEAIAQERLDLEQRMSAMLSKIETLERAISVKSPELAQLQSQLEEGVEPTIATDEAASTELTMDGAALTESLADADLETDGTTANNKIADDVPFPPVLPLDQTEATQEPVVTATENVAAIDVDTAENAVLDEVETAATNMTAAAVDTTESVGFIGKIFGLLKLLLLPLLLGLAGLMGWLFWRSRNQDSDYEDSWEEMAVDTPTSEVRAKELVAEAKINLAEVEEVSGVEEADSHFSDLMLEADTYINYENYSKAQSVLESAHQLEPNNNDVTEKLLFVLYQQKDGAGFEALAEQAETQLKENPTQWKKIAEWGEGLSPGSALFAGFAAASGAVVAAGAAENVAESESPIEEPMDLLDPSLEMGNELLDSGADDALLDFPVEFASAAVPEDGEFGNTDLKDMQAAAIESADSTLEDNTETSLSLELPATDLPADSASADEVALGDFESVDEVTTKLDLATAYLEMDEKDGARAILEEVLEEGDKAQKAQAKKLLDSL
jgi:pilus assembly protein FimV